MDPTRRRFYLKSKIDASEKNDVKSAVPTRGFTWRVYAGVLYSIIILQPAIIWLMLTTGQSLVGAAVLITTLLFTEVFRLSGKPLTKQETFILYAVSGLSGAGIVGWIGHIYALWYRASPYVNLFGITGIPDWFAPPPTSPVHYLRTFFHPDWIAPISLITGLSLIGEGIGLITGFIMRQLFIETERLPFPMADPSAEAMLTLSEREKSKINIFAIATFISLAYSLLVYFLPMMTLALFKQAFTVLPIPWIDLTYWFDKVLPGTQFGIATDLLAIALGFLLPSEVVISSFLGSFAIYFVGNYFLVRQGLFVDYLPGAMSIQDLWQRSMLCFWASPNIGLAIAAGIIPIVTRPKVFYGAFLSLIKMRKTIKEATGLSSWFILLSYFAATFSVALIAHMLVPDFPFWIFIFMSVVWSFFGTLISTRSIGITGMPLDVPYIREELIMSSGYTAVDVWFLPGLYTTAGANWCQSFKICELLDTPPSELVKAYVYSFPVAWLVSFLYVQLFWRLSPIPSAVYPYTIIYWPINAINSSLWISRSVTIFNPQLILGGVIVGGALYAATSTLHIPFSLIGFASGAAAPIPGSFSLLIGYIIGRIFAIKFGRIWWNKNRAVIVAGLTMGEGLAIGLGAAISMTAKAMLSYY